MEKEKNLESWGLFFFVSKTENILNKRKNNIRKHGRPNQNAC